MKVIWRILGRFYEARSRRASKLSAFFKGRAEMFFQRVKGRSYPNTKRVE